MIVEPKRINYPLLHMFSDNGDLLGFLGREGKELISGEEGDYIWCVIRNSKKYMIYVYKCGRLILTRPPTPETPRLLKVQSLLPYGFEDVDLDTLEEIENFTPLSPVTFSREREIMDYLREAKHDSGSVRLFGVFSHFRIAEEALKQVQMILKRGEIEEWMTGKYSRYLYREVPYPILSCSKLIVRKDNWEREFYRGGGIEKEKRWENIGN